MSIFKRNEQQEFLTNPNIEYKISKGGVKYVQPTIKLEDLKGDEEIVKLPAEDIAILEEILMNSKDIKPDEIKHIAYYNLFMNDLRGESEEVKALFTEDCIVTVTIGDDSIEIPFLELKQLADNELLALYEKFSNKK